MTEQVNNDFAQLVSRVVAAAPFRWKRIFVNYEMKDSDHGMVGDCIAFSVRANLFGKVERVDMSLGANEWVILNRIGRYFMARAGQNHMTLDLLVRNDKTFKTYLDYDAPIRLSGNLRAYERHLKYVTDDPILGKVK